MSARPTSADIAKAPRLTTIAAATLARVDRDMVEVCNICGNPGDLNLWRECDERDKPLPGRAMLLFVAMDHATCYAQLGGHPRAYARASESPGRFGALCGPCVFRRGAKCTHGDLKENGGAGLHVTIRSAGELPLGMIVCRRGRGGGCGRSATKGVKCTGRRTLRIVGDATR